MSHRLAATGALAAVLCAGCVSHPRQEQAREEMQVLLAARGVLARQEEDRLVACGHEALPAIEEGLAGGPPAEVRARLLDALERIGDPEAVPLLRQEMAYEPDPAARAQALAILRRWAADGTEPRAMMAQSAIARSRALRALESPPPPAHPASRAGAPVAATHADLRPVPALGRGNGG